MSNQTTALDGAQEYGFQNDTNSMITMADHDSLFDLYSIPIDTLGYNKADPMTFTLTSVFDESHALTGKDKGNAPILPTSIPKQDKKAQKPTDVSLTNSYTTGNLDQKLVECLKGTTDCTGSKPYRNVKYSPAMLPITPEPIKELTCNKNDVDLYSHAESQTSISTNPGTSYADTPFGLPTKYDIAKRTTSNHFESHYLQTSALQNNNKTYQPQTIYQAEPSETSLSKQSDIDDPEAAFKTILPLLRKVTPRNSSEVLVHCLREYHHHISLEALFNLLYSKAYSRKASPFTHTENIQGREPQGKTLQFFCHILNWFHDAQPSREQPSKAQPSKAQPSRVQPSRVQPSSCIQKEKVSPVSFPGVLRTLLAIKVVFSCIEMADDNSIYQESLSRVSCYKVYYVLCQRLSKTQKFASSYSLESIILGHSKLGHIIRLVHPNLGTKRLGPRGQSKFHYMGLRWNDALVDEDMLKVLDVEIPQLRKHCKYKTPVSDKGPKQISTEPELVGVPAQTFKAPQIYSNVHAPYVWSTPLHSFVDISYTYPDSDCSPRLWHSSPNKVPPQSEWSKTIMERSMTALSQHKIDLRPLTENIANKQFSNAFDSGLSASIQRSINTLQFASARKEVYMDLYLVILLTLFPVVIASDAELPLSSKLQLRGVLTGCVRDLEATFSGTNDVINLRFFVTNLKRMLNLSTLTSCKTNPRYTEMILQEKVSEIESRSISKAEGFLLSRSELEDFLIHSIIRSFNAFNFAPIADTCVSTAEGNIKSIYSLSNTLVEVLMRTKHDMHSLLAQSRSKESTGAPQDLPYQVLKISIQLFHEYSLVDPLVKKLPIPVFNYVLRNLSEVMQSDSVDNFQKGDVEFSKENFKCWWVCFMMYQDYLDILSEIVSLSAILGKTP